MTDTGWTAAVGAQAASMGQPRSYGSDTDDRSGWIAFAGIMVILLGGFPDHRRSS